MFLTCKDIKNETDKDESLVKLKSYIKNGFPVNLDTNLSSFKNII